MYSERNKCRVSHPAQAGLSLVEIMVGVLIGMIGIIVIFQMLATSESRKRTVSAGSDVQVSGVIGLTSIERDVREAGYGFSSAAYDTGITPVMGCTVNAYDSGRPTPAFTYRLTPVQIIQGAGAASDTVIVLRGNGNTFPAAHVFTESSDTSKKTRGRAGISPRDYVLIGRVTPTLDCMTAEITDVSDADALTVRHNQGSYNYTTYLPDGSTSVESRIARHNNVAPPTAFTAGYIFNLGNAPRRNIWTVLNGKLQVTNDLLYQDTNGNNINDPVEVADNVVSLQAQYGIDANNNGRIETGEWTTTDPATTIQWANVLAVRLGILVRSAQFERQPNPNPAEASNPNNHVTTTVPSWAGGQFVITNLDALATASTNKPSDPAQHWKNYRYRVYETVIPLRNMLWGSQIRP
jgi:type IV pilus assembly protein PilW